MSIVRIKRSQNTHAPASLEAGELSYSANGDLLYIGRPDGSNTVTAIAGKRYPGLLTANQALVVNSSSAIDKIIVANVVPTALTANGSVGTDGQVLTSNGSTVYWQTLAPGGVTSVTGANGLITTGTSSVTLEVGAGNGISTNADYVSVLAGNSQLISNSTGVWIDQTKINHNLLSNYVANEHIDHSTVSISTANGIAGGGNITTTRNLYVVANSGLLSNASGVFVVANSGLSTNSTGVFVTAGSGIASNSTGVHVVAGNSQVVSNSSGVFIDQTKINHNLLSNYVANEHVDHSTVSISSGSGLTGGGNITATRTLSVLANNGIVANSTGVYVNANNGLSTNSTGVFVVGGNGIAAVNATGVHVGAAGGLTVNSSAVSILANNGVVANATGLYVNANNGLSVNSTGLFVVGGDGLVSNSTGVHVGAANGISVAADSVGVLGGSTLTVNSTGVHVNSALSITDLTLSGNLTVSGTLVTVDATNLTVNDSIIELARNNGANVLDIGFYGQYNDGSARYTGLIWDTSTSTYELFANTTAEPDTTLNTAGTGFTRSTLSAYLQSGWGTGKFVANSTGVTITANSTYAVSLTANTLSLSTALPATSGGTGWASFTAGDLLTASNTSYLSKLSLGASGKILQSNGTAVVYDDVDGGVFAKDALFLNRSGNDIFTKKGKATRWQTMDLAISGGMENFNTI